MVMIGMIRLQKLLAGAGLGSRRTIEEWIRAGRLTVGGKVAQLGDRAGPADDIRLDGRRLELDARALSARELLLYYKPVGEVTTRSDPAGAPDRVRASAGAPARGAGSTSGAWT